MLNILRDENGQGMVEYGLILGLIAVAAIVAIATLGPKIREFFEGANDALDEPQIRRPGAKNNVDCAIEYKRDAQSGMNAAEHY